MKFTGVVLAGGRSSRFPPDKLRVSYKGAPLLHHPILKLAEVCGEVLLVLSPDAPAPDPPPGVSVRTVRDASDGQGPLAGVAAALGEAHTDWVLVAGGDMPELVSGVLREMLRTAEVAQEEGAQAVALREGADPSPLPVALNVAPALEASRVLLDRGERRLASVIEALRTAVIDEETWTGLDPQRLTLRDIDTPDDLTP